MGRVAALESVAYLLSAFIHGACFAGIAVLSLVMSSSHRLRRRRSHQDSGSIL